MKHKKFFQKHKRELSLHKRTYKQRFVLLVLVLITLGNLAVVAASAVMSVFLPSVSEITSLMGAESTVFFDSKGEVLFTVSEDEDRENVDAEKIPELVKLAAISIEDDNFYKHNGFDLGGLFKAVLSELGFGARRGGSTITQQFIKNSLLSNERTYIRKFKELVLAVKLERHATKEQVLMMYLNRIPYGGTAYGVQKASQVFFDKEIEELGLEEAAILASLPKAPTYFSPYGDHKHTQLTKEFTAEELLEREIEDITDLKDSEYTYGLLGKDVQLADDSIVYLPGRADEVLKRMQDLGHISRSQRAEAETNLKDYEFNELTTKTKAFHFVTYVKQLLEEKYGQELVENGGLKVYTTLDYEVQKQVEASLKEQAEFNTRFDTNNAAVVSVEAKTGHIKAMVGSKDFSNQEIEGYNNMVLAKRQPGSTFKPISYAAAMLNGLSPGHTLFDIPIKIGEDEPNNFDGEFMGPISVRKALGQSRNIPAVKSYYIGGEQDMILELSEKIGISSLDQSADYGWPLSLGTGELSMLELAQAYTVFANDGLYRPINPILKVVAADGEVLEDNTEIEELDEMPEVLDPRVAFMINDILSDTSVNLGRLLSLADGRDAAAKTGTSTKKIGDIIYPTNLWTAGWTPDFVTIAWAGNSDGSKMSLDASGYVGATPIWHNTMNLLHEEVETSEFQKPDKLERVLISSLSGDLPSNTTPLTLVSEDWFLPDFVPVDPDNSFYQAVIDERNLKLPNEYCPRRFVKAFTFFDNSQAEKFTPRLLADRQAEVAEWFMLLDQEAREKLNLGENLAIGKPIQEESQLCRAEYANKYLALHVLNLADGFYLDYGTNSVLVDVDSESEVDKVEYYLNDELQYTAIASPYTGTLRVPKLLSKNTKLKASMRLYDINGYLRQVDLDLRIGASSKNPKEFTRASADSNSDLDLFPVMQDLNQFLNPDAPADNSDANGSNLFGTGAQKNPGQNTSRVLEFNPDRFIID